MVHGLQNYTNPNDCPGAATMFISHNYTSYFDVERLYSQKFYEAADHSVTHKVPDTWWLQASVKDWTDEIAGEKEILHRFVTVLDSLTSLPPCAPSLLTSLSWLAQSNFNYSRHHLYASRFNAKFGYMQTFAKLAYTKTWWTLSKSRFYAKYYYFCETQSVNRNWFKKQKTEGLIWQWLKIIYSTSISHL